MYEGRQLATTYHRLDRDNLRRQGMAISVLRVLPPACLFFHFRRKKEVNTDPRIPRFYLVLSRLL